MPVVAASEDVPAEPARVKEILANTLDESRGGGDGESLPDTPPNERVSEGEKLPKMEGLPPATEVSNPADARNPFKMNFSVDMMAVMLFVAGLVTRLYRLDQPRHVVFDEMHYGKYASLYLKNTFFFDANPPLGKLLIAFAGYVSGFDGGNFGFDKIGTSYPEDIPHVVLRLVPAIFGALLTPTVFLILSELHAFAYAGYLASFMVVFDTALLTQSRFILLESMMIFFAMMSVYSALKMRHYYENPFGLGWTLWLVSASANMGLAFSVKYLAFYSCTLCITILLRDYWTYRLGNPKVTHWQVLIEFCSEIAAISLIPVAIYIGCFYVHLSVLTKAGHHDSLMTSAFQASLEGGLSSIVRGQPSAVAHGSQITLRHTHGRTCWLHSHEHVYPIRYPDGRGSSHQQQVSCYGYKDVNNWWIVKRPEREDLAVHEPIDVIKDGDVIQLVHGMTHRAFNSHDVAAPMSPHNQEVTCYIDYNISMSAENLWRVEIINKDQTGDGVWHSIGSQIRLIHEKSKQALKYSGRVYPDWGFHQNEVVCDKIHNQLDAIWNVEEHRYTKDDADKNSIEKELFQAELIPEEPTELSFMEKFVELQIKMLVTNQENVQNHNYASDPIEWPFLTRGIAYFISKTSNAQVRLLGNIVIWYTCSSGVLVYTALLVFYLLRRRRLCYDISEASWDRFVVAGQVLLGGYLFHYIPFFFYDRTLFVHHYLPAYVYKLMLTAYLISHAEEIITSTYIKVLMYLIIATWMAAVIHIFNSFSHLSFGDYPLSADEVKTLRWKDTWDLIIHKP